MSGAYSPFDEGANAVPRSHHRPRKPHFILGVGAQKAGTSWLHKELSRCKEINFGFCKEYKAFPHLQAARSTSAPGWFNRQSQFDTTTFEQLTDIEKLQSMREDPRCYLHYFRGLIAGDPTLQATGDLSPHYAELNSRQFRQVRRLLEAGGFEVKVILLLRDPVERIWSQLRMLRRQNRFPQLCGYRHEETALAVLHHHPRFATKTQYHQTLKALEQSFPSDCIHVEFYEQLFTTEAHIRLQHFLNLELPPAEFETRVNASPKQANLCPMLEQTVALAYRDVYEAMIDRFGNTVLDLWPHARWLQANTCR